MAFPESGITIYFGQPCYLDSHTTMPETPPKPARLPPFSALRAFEAAARHENFSRAAEELHLTHGAISHQVRALEVELGRPLFVRNGRHVKITADGLKFALFLGKSFADIAIAAD